MNELIFELSVPGRKGYSLPERDVPEMPLNGKFLRKEKAALPELSELDIVRHFTVLSRKNFCVDTNFYPLGSCTMKYNSKAVEAIAGNEAFLAAHPVTAFLPGGEEHVQGMLSIVHGLEHALSEITGMDAFCTHPLAGAHGEYAGLSLIAAYHRAKGNKKKHVIVPDSSHGTNPASAAFIGYDVITIPTRENGDMDFEKFSAALTDEVAAVMLTCPDTLGIFNPHIREICDRAHTVDALVYYDGANLNAIMGKLRPGDVGFDVVHVNVHKTFGTPHGGGGPGAGPVGVKKHLIPFLPTPRIVKKKDTFSLILDEPKSIGKVTSYFGNFGILIRAYAYILLLGKEGLIDASEKAVLNANYVRALLRDTYHEPYARACFHECVFSAAEQMKHDIHAIDIAKFLIDKGIHPPTVYFPITVPESIMIEPTETESKETLDVFIAAMKEAAAFAVSDPDALHRAPVTTPVDRLDETSAARTMRVTCIG
ncbi:MAG: aminomethyl-transferring glycine dehydrogenase subunit GcvPB [Spirochaetota bacterium]